MRIALRKIILTHYGSALSTSLSYEETNSAIQALYEDNFDDYIALATQGDGYAGIKAGNIINKGYYDDKKINKEQGVQLYANVEQEFSNDKLLKDCARDKLWAMKKDEDSLEMLEHLIMRAQEGELDAMANVSQTHTNARDAIKWAIAWIREVKSLRDLFFFARSMLKSPPPLQAAVQKRIHQAFYPQETMPVLPRHQHHTKGQDSEKEEEEKVAIAYNLRYQTIAETLQKLLAENPSLEKEFEKELEEIRPATFPPALKNIIRYSY